MSAQHNQEGLSGLDLSATHSAEKSVMRDITNTMSDIATWGIHSPTVGAQKQSSERAMSGCGDAAAVQPDLGSLSANTLSTIQTHRHCEPDAQHSSEPVACLNFMTLQEGGTKPPLKVDVSHLRGT